MYKTRLRKWGLRKYQEGLSGRVTLDLTLDSDRPGDRSEISVSGRPSDLNDLRNLLRRHGLDIRAGQGGGRSLRLTHAVAVAHPVPGSRAPAIQAPMRAPDDLQSLEESHRIMWGYARGCIEVGAWTYDERLRWFLSCQGFEAWEELSGWLSRVVEAVQYIHHHHHHQARANGDTVVDENEDGFRLLSACLDDLAARVLRNRDPGTIFYLLALTRIAIPGLRRSLTRHVQDLVDVVLGTRHPLALLWQRLVSGNAASPESLERFIGAAVDPRVGNRQQASEPRLCGGFPVIEGNCSPRTPQVVCAAAAYAEMLDSLSDGDGGRQRLVRITAVMMWNARGPDSPCRRVVAAAIVDTLLDSARALRLVGAADEARPALAVVESLLSGLDHDFHGWRVARYTHELAKLGGAGYVEGGI